MNTGWPSSVPNHLRGREREEREEELEGGGEDGAGLAGPTGASTICHCRILDRPHASKHFNTAQPTSNHPRSWDHGQEAASDLCLFHVRHTMNESIHVLVPFHVHLTPGEKHMNERKRTNNKAGNEWLQALENRLIGQMGRALERIK
ncbi:hypothetical protein DPX16_11746 [Anabarilius grahami]|uniref:Uncharacterized protein n=1 Tax=Anabarilius grahami TaxID=495550 RepID=A0A3N0Z8B5_ANAGA|nr:hypothetical protein DPX16_11746 [Anabarilius grahami]